MGNFTKQVTATYGNTCEPLLEVSYHKLYDMFIITSEKNSITVQKENVPALISMLQSVLSDVK